MHELVRGIIMYKNISPIQYSTTLLNKYRLPPHDAVLPMNALFPVNVAFDSDIIIAAPSDP